MGLNGSQIFVAETAVERVTGLIQRYVEKVGSAAAVDFDSEKPSSEVADRTQREFTVSDPRNGIICIWEDGVWGDKNLARYLSKELETRSFWLGHWFDASEWAYVIYANGAVADSLYETFDPGEIDETDSAEMDETEEASEPSEMDRSYKRATEFASRHKLPFALIYLPDPRMPAIREMAKKAFQDLLGTEPELEGRVEVEYNFDEGVNPEDLLESDEAVEALRRLRAEAESFPKLTIPCTSSE